MYTIIKDTDGKEMCIKKIADDLCIPFDSANTDYQAYLKWVEQGGVPIPADE